MIVLDTCAVLWMAFNRAKFSSGALAQLDSASRLIINTMCFWEIGIKVKKSKLELPISVSELASLYANNANVELVAPDIRIILDSLDLDWQHRDPVDRIVVATARKEKLPIATSDQHICNYYSATII